MPSWMLAKTFLRKRAVSSGAARDSVFDRRSLLAMRPLREPAILGPEYRQMDGWA
jgi:hypothetical protein